MGEFSTTSDLQSYRERLLSEREPARTVVAICGGTGCHAYGSQSVIEAFHEAVAAAECADKVRIMPTGCHGFCERGPLVVIHPDRILYQQVKPRHAADIINKTVIGNEIIDALLYQDPQTGTRYTYEHELPFYANQHGYIGKLEQILQGDSNIVHHAAL